MCNRIQRFSFSDGTVVSKVVFLMIQLLNSIVIISNAPHKKPSSSTSESSRYSEMQDQNAEAVPNPYEIHLDDDNYVDTDKPPPSPSSRAKLVVKNENRRQKSSPITEPVQETDVSI